MSIVSLGLEKRDEISEGPREELQVLVQSLEK